MKTEVLRGYKFALAPTPRQEQQLLRWCGNARLAFNYALAMKKASHQAWRAQIDALVQDGVPETEARKKVSVRTPRKPDVYTSFQAARGDSRTGAEGICPWWHEVNTYVFQSAFFDADQAWKNWLDSFKGKRAGRRLGYPKFKKRGRGSESFRLHKKGDSLRFATHRRLRLQSFGEMRLHQSAKHLTGLIQRGDAVVQSVTVRRSGHRWYASVLCKVTMDLPEGPSRAQQEAGTVGVDLGVKCLAALSKPLMRDDYRTMLVPNPRHLAVAMRRLKKAQRVVSRSEKRSRRREKAKKRVGRLHHQIAVQRHAALHQVTKKLAAAYATVAIEDLNVSGMTRSAKGTADAPGRNVRQKAGLNRSILDTAMGETRRQLIYKTSWYGSKLAVLNRWWPSSKTCSECGWQNPRLTLSDRMFTCDKCGITMDRDLNAARNIEGHAVVAPDPNVVPDTGETQNARGADVRPASLQARRRSAVKREDTKLEGLVPPQRSDPLTVPVAHVGNGPLLEAPPLGQ